MRTATLTALVVSLAAGSLDARAHGACPASGPEPALEEIHRVQNQSREAIETALRDWLPVVGCLEDATGVVEEGWLHLAADVGRLLVHLERLEEARTVFTSVTDRDREGRWGSVAALRLYALENLRPGMPAPGFEGRTLSGETLASDELVGDIVLLDFWATWCAPCVNDLDTLKDLLRRFGDEGLTIVGVALDENREPVERLTAEESVTWPQLWDGKAATFYLLDRRGRIAAGPLGGDLLEAAVTQVLSHGE
jgi:thiol-disulfide isomerase/thioredoxin